ncbi:hypothetical protein Nepgr_020870 [Nepenthes gracilis]|uniref:Uncharacterized protein n=1 Tax=Nepenthes gracilis TaxID=150966 RepID=A0AAD3SXQ0_NEPGR|nr:hypothetical protein Nepgr_020870 [Nepenthes gracilis]
MSSAMLSRLPKSPQFYCSLQVARIKWSRAKGESKKGERECCSALFFVAIDVDVAIFWSHYALLAHSLCSRGEAWRKITAELSLLIL